MTRASSAESADRSGPAIAQRRVKAAYGSSGWTMEGHGTHRMKAAPTSASPLGCCPFRSAYRSKCYPELSCGRLLRLEGCTTEQVGL